MSLTAMVEGLLTQAKRIDAYLAEKKLAAPTWDEDTLADLPAELDTVRERLFNDAHDFAKLVHGPTMSTMEIAFSWTDALPLTIVYHYKLAEAVPLDGSASYAEIARKSGLNEDKVFRCIRAVMGNHVFAEDASTGRVHHTAISRLIATNRGLQDVLGLELEDFGPTASYVVAAWEKWGQSASEPNQVAYSLGKKSDLSIFPYLSQHPELARRFASAMDFLTRDESWDLRHLAASYDWSQLDRPGSVLVDVGGSFGHVSEFLAQHTQHVHFVVEDLPSVISQAAAKDLPAQLQGRLSFVEQNFLQARRTAERKADAILLRWILHNWHDVNVQRILRHLVTVLKPGTKVFVYEYVLDKAPMLDWSRRFAIRLDMVMLTCFNGRERSAVQFQKLFSDADPRYVFTAVHRAHGSAMSLIELTWTP